MIDLLIGVMVFAIVAGFGYWILTLIPLPEPFKKIAIVAFLLICFLILIVYFALPFLHTGYILRRP
jgi:hypothetical protein